MTSASNPDARRSPARQYELHLPGVGNTRWLVGTVTDVARMVLARALEARTLICTVNVDTLRLAQQDEEFASVLRGAICVADGWPIARYCSAQLGSSVPRVAGSDLTRILLRDGSSSMRAAVIGGSPECHRLLSQRTYAGATPILWNEAPTRSEAADRHYPTRLAERSVSQPPNVVLFAFGQPLQEILAAQYLQAGGRGICIGVGGSLDMLVGLQRRAPGALQRIRGEWLWRMATSPRRLALRYLADLPVAIRLLVGSGRRAIKGHKNPG